MGHVSLNNQQNKYFHQFFKLTICLSKHNLYSTEIFSLFINDDMES